jgi:hypothetical protein
MSGIIVADVRYSLDDVGFFTPSSRRHMPRVPDDIVQSVVYVYPNRGAAEKREILGGSGVLLSMPLNASPDWVTMYVLSNSHVVRDFESPAILVNTADGKTDILEIHNCRWVHHQDGYDLAVAPIKPTEAHQFKCVPVDWLLTEDQVKQYDIGPGDEVFMVGRFVNEEGRRQIIPSVRFGHIAMMPTEPTLATMALGEQILIECLSIPGYSGSPVFLFCLPFTASKIRTDSPPGLLVGLDSGHIRDFYPVLSDKFVETSQSVAVNTGMATVIPGWRIMELLMSPVLVSERDTADRIFSEKLERARRHYAPDSVVGGEARFTREDFEDALKKTSRKLE